MTYNEFVKRPNRIRRRISHKIEDVMLKESICMRTTTTLGERVQTSPTNSQEIAYLRYIDAKNDLNELATELETAQTEVRDFFYGNLSFDDADLLEWRYIDGKNLQEIADTMNIAYQTAKNKLNNADKRARSKYYESSTKKY